MLNKKLSALQPGSYVRFINLSGQVIEGIVTENDKEESLSVQITSLATIRYDQIGMLDKYGQSTIVTQDPSLTNNIVPVPAPPKENEPAAEPTPLTVEIKHSAVEIKQLKGDTSALKQAYRALESDEKKAFTQPYDKFQSYLKSHEETKYNETINLIWDAIGYYHWNFNPRANLFLAQIQLLHNDYDQASESFFYAGNYRDAYCAAYQGADNDNGLYKQAAAYTCIYLTTGSPKEIAEASEVLKKNICCFKGYFRNRICSEKHII